MSIQQNNSRTGQTPTEQDLLNFSFDAEIDVLANELVGSPEAIGSGTRHMYGVKVFSSGGMAVVNPDGTNIFGSGGTFTSSPTYKDDPTNTGETPKYGKTNSVSHKQMVEADITLVGGAAFTLGQQLAAASLPIVLTASQLSALTPPAAITGFAKESGGNLDTIVADLTNGTQKTQVTALPALPAGANVIGEVGTAPAAVKVGQTVSNTSRVQLTASSIGSTNGILVQALSTNAASVFLGDSTVTTGNGFEIQPGQGVPFTATNINLLYVIGANNTDGVCWNVL